MQWEQFVRKALQQFQFDEGLIPGGRFSEAWKLAIASWLKRHSSVSNAWLSKRLNMGAPNAVSNNCGRYQREREGSCSYAKKLKDMKYEQ